MKHPAPVHERDRIQRAATQRMSPGYTYRARQRPAKTLQSVACLVQPGATVITDAWMGYHGLAEPGYVHQRRSQRAARARGEDPGELLPAVHRVASLAKRWLLGTHQGPVDEAHLPGYLNEFAFRFNRRRSASRGLVFCRLLELAAGHDPVRYRDLIVRQRSKAPPAPPGTRGHPPSLERPGANRRGGQQRCSYGCPTPVKWIPQTPVTRRVCCASLRMSVAASLTMSTLNRTFRAREWPTALMVAAGCSW